MLIDWFTVAAQVLNFLVLVWLMKRFLYKPILRAIDEREKRIDSELADAAAKQGDAGREREEFQRKNEDFDRERAGLLAKAVEDAKVERARLLDEARKAADALTTKRRDGLRIERRNLNEAIGRRTAREAFDLARKALADLAGTSLEERIAEVFVRRLREVDGDAKSTLADAFRTATSPALVRSAFDLSGDQRGAIQKALNETFSADIRLGFETASSPIAGIELSANGRKIAWSIGDYLSSLEKRLDEILGERANPEPDPDPAPESDEPEPESKGA